MHLREGEARMLSAQDPATLNVKHLPVSAATSSTETNAYIRTGASNGANGKAPSVQLLRKIRAELISARPLAELGLPARAERAMVRHGIQTVGVLITWSRCELTSEVIGLGPASLDLIEAALVGFNLSLAPGTAGNRRPMTSPLTNARHVRNHNAWTGPD